MIKNTLLFILTFINLEASLMEDFPPSPENQVTIENWMEGPYNRWGFQNVRRLSPTAEISNGSTSPLERDEKPLLSLTLPNDLTVNDALESIYADGFIVLSKGKIITEAYFNSMKAETQHILWSCSKSILGTMAGILIEQGTINVNAKIAEYIPELINSGYADATIQNLLDMTVALEQRTDDEFSSFKPDKEWSAYHFVQSVYKEGNHGETFSYLSPNAIVLGWMMEKVTGKFIPDLVSELIWEPMGAEFPGNSIVDGIGSAQPSGGFSITLRDFARFGQMILQKGNFNGKQIIPSHWIDDSRENGDTELFRNSAMGAMFPGGSYHNMWWINPNKALMALGSYGQILYIDFETETVIAIMTSQPHVFTPEHTFFTQQIIEVIINGQ